jgi:hypothetical protein
LGSQRHPPESVAHAAEPALGGSFILRHKKLNGLRVAMIGAGTL